jgi:hypothetical protein
LLALMEHRVEQYRVDGHGGLNVAPEEAAPLGAKGSNRDTGWRLRAACFEGPSRLSPDAVASIQSTGVDRTRCGSHPRT